MFLMFKFSSSVMRGSTPSTVVKRIDELSLIENKIYLNNAVRFQFHTKTRAEEVFLSLIQQLDHQGSHNIVEFPYTATEASLPLLDVDAYYDYAEEDEGAGE